MAAETEPFESTDVTPLGSGFLGWVKSEVYRRKVGACSHFGCCCPHKESEDQIRQKKTLYEYFGTHSLHAAQSFLRS